MAEPDASQERKRLMPVWLPIVLSLAVLGVVAYLTVGPDTLDDLREVRWWVLLLAPVALVLRVLFGAWRLLYFSRGQLQWPGAFRAQLAWDFFSSITPSTLGGGPIAPAYIARDNRIPLGDATGLMLFAILIDQVWFSCSIVLVIAASIFVDLIPDTLGVVGQITFVLYGAGFMVWTALFAISTFFKPEVLIFLVQKAFSIPLLRRFKGRALRVMVTLRERAALLRHQRPGFYCKGLLLTVASWISRYALVVIILASLSVDLDLVLATVRTIAMKLGALAIPTPGGAGGVEGLFALMLGPLIAQSLVAPALILWRLLGYYVFLAVGAYLTAHQVLKKTAAKQSPA